MGVGYSVYFTKEELEEYEFVTCLTSADILDLYRKFKLLGGHRAKESAPAGDLERNGEKKAPLKALLSQKEFIYNPFAQRLCEVFSSEPAFSPTWGDLNFDEYVDMYNCLSPDAPKDVKMKTAFRLYDFDGNGYLTTEDLEWLLRTIATPPGKKSGKPRNCLFEQHEINEIVERVMRDCDVDGNHRLSYAEFSKVLDRVPGFTNRFCIDIN